MISVKSLCGDAMGKLTRAGALPDFMRTGRFAPDVIQERRTVSPRQQMILHYADLRGPLYADRSAWRLAWALIDSYTPGSVDRGDSRFVLPSPWADWPVQYEALRQVLPQVAHAVGFTSLGGRRIMEFVANEECLMEDLPEPYGKWYQHVEKRPRWGERIKLRFKLSCTLTPGASACTRLDLKFSSFALPAARALAERLAHEFELPMPSFRPGYFTSPVELVIGGTSVDLRGLDDPAP
jgi:hypothetical protein